MLEKYVNKSIKFSILIISLLCLLGLTGCQPLTIGVLNPKGIIASQERQLLFDSTALMLIVVIPVIIMSFVFIVRYRASHKTAEYKPNWGHSVFLEAIWWGVPCAIVIVLAIMTWKMTHKLDPYRRINTAGVPMLIQGVALPWKWLFIYPAENIATVNFLEIPKGRQVAFWLTADNVAMSAFFIPQLGSQIYTMAGMRTRLHLLALENGTFEGLNANFNGNGFSDMSFTVKVVNPDQMQKWVKKVKQMHRELNDARYQKLLAPVVSAPVEYYSAVKPNLFNEILNQYKQTGDVHPRSQFNVAPNK